MQIERKAGLFDLGPKRPILREVVIDRLPAVANLRKPVDQRAAEAERLDAALQFDDGEFGVLHRKRGKGLEPRRPFRDLLGEKVVGADRNLVGARDVGNRLNRRRVQ